MIVTPINREPSAKRFDKMAYASSHLYTRAVSPFSQKNNIKWHMRMKKGKKMKERIKSHLLLRS